MKVQIWVDDPVALATWRSAAREEGMSLSSWLRRAANRMQELEFQARSRAGRPSIIGGEQIIEAGEHGRVSGPADKIAALRGAKKGSCRLISNK